MKGRILADLGERPEAERLLKLVHDLDVQGDLRELFEDELALGHFDECVALLERETEKAVLHANVAAAYLRLEPSYDPLRPLPRFQALQARLDADPRFSPTAKATSNPSAGTPIAKPDVKSVAVLAFANLSDDKSNEYFSDGISEELLTVLQKIPGLHVAARTSAFSFKGKNATAQEIGEKLGVAHLVEGSVQKSGNRVKITARLSRVATGEELWSKSFPPQELTDAFAAESEIAQAIVGELRGRLTGEAAKAEIQAQVAAAEIGGTRNSEAHELYLQGRFFSNQFTVENLRRAEALLQRAVELDPSFAQAWVQLARTAGIRFGYDTTRAGVDGARKLEQRAGTRALELAPNLAAAQLAQFDVQIGDFEWKQAAESLRRAVALAPNDPEVVQAQANAAYYFGRREDAIQLSRQALALDPVNPSTRVTYGFALNSVGRFDESDAEFQRVAELSPEAPWGHSGVSINLAARGRFDDAAKEAAREVNEWSRLFALTIAQWGQKNPAESDATLKQLIDRFAEVCAFQVSQVYASRKDLDRAFEWLERAYRQHDPGLAWSKADSLLVPLHGNPRWPVFLKKIGLSDEQLK